LNQDERNYTPIDVHDCHFFHDFLDASETCTTILSTITGYFFQGKFDLSSKVADILRRFRTDRTLPRIIDESFQFSVLVCQFAFSLHFS
jgi:hypothetical protein